MLGIFSCAKSVVTVSTLPCLLFFVWCVNTNWTCFSVLFVLSSASLYCKSPKTLLLALCASSCACSSFLWYTFCKLESWLSSSDHTGTVALKTESWPWPEHRKIWSWPLIFSRPKHACRRTPSASSLSCSSQPDGTRTHVGLSVCCCVCVYYCST